LIDLKEINNNIFKKENFYFLITILFIFSIDRYSKIRIINDYSDSTFYLNNFLNFHLTWNTGIGFGLMSSNSPLFYNLISIIIAITILVLVIIGIKSDKIDKIAFSVIIGGALGNFYDRAIFKAVPDFIDIHYGNFHWFTFNVADIFISIGIISYLVKGLFIKEK